MVGTATPESPLQPYVVASLKVMGQSAPPSITSSRKRASMPSPPARPIVDKQVARVTQMAELLRSMMFNGNIDQELVPRFMDRADVATSTLPPLPTLVPDATPLGVYSSTTASVGDVTSPWMFNSTETMASAALTSTDRMIRSVWSGIRAFSNIGENLQATNRKRQAAGLEPAEPTSIANFLYFSAQGVRNILGVARDLWSGRARLNATNTNSAQPVMASVAWTLTTPNPTTQTPEQKLGAAALSNTLWEIGWRRLLGPLTISSIRNWWRSMGYFSNRMSSLAATDARYVERTKRIAELSALIARIRHGDALAVAAIDPTECLTTQVFCENCFLLDQLLGTSLLVINATVTYYTNDNPPRPESTFAYMSADYDYVLGKLFTNRTTYATFGDSSENPAYWPAKGLSLYDNFWGDPIPGKTGFDSFQPLVDATLNFFSTLFGTADVTAPDTYGISSSASATTSSSLSVLPPLKNTGTRFDVLLAPMDRAVSKAAHKALLAMIAARNMSTATWIRAQAFESFSDLVIGWLDVFLEVVWRCPWPTLLTSKSLRFSLAQGLVIVGALLSFFLLVWLAVPGAGGIIFGPIGGIALLIALMTGYAISTGWAFTCGPAQPPILWTKLAMHFVTDVLLPPAPLLLLGLVKEPAYFVGHVSNTECARCEVWRDGVRNMGNCFNDYGFQSVLDVPVYYLKVYAPSVLEALQDPTTWPFPLSALIGSSMIQEALHRFDNVDFETNDAPTYAHLHACPPILATFTILVLTAIGLLLLALAPGRALLRLLATVALILLKTAVLLAFSLGYQIAFQFQSVGDMLPSETTDTV